MGGTTWDAPNQAVVHAMRHPDKPDRYITIFHANGDSGWSRLRLIQFYSRDTSIIWEGDQVVKRRTFEPEWRLSLPPR